MVDLYKTQIEDTNANSTSSTLLPKPVTAQPIIATPPATAQPAPIQNTAPVKTVASVSNTPSDGIYRNADGTIDFQRSLDAAKETALNIQKQVQTLTAKQTTDASGIVASSAPAIQDEKNVTNDVKNLNTQLALSQGATPVSSTTPNPNPVSEASARTASSKYVSTLDDQIAALEDRRKQEVAQIEQEFAVTKDKTQKAQDAETGSTTATFARIGGYLGGSASATGAMIKLAQSHRDEMTILDQKKQVAINAANNAVDDKQFDLARLKAQEAKDIESTINDRKNTFFNQTMSVVQEQRQQAQDFRTNVKDDLVKLASVDPATVPADKLAQIDQVYGVPGFAKNYLDVSNAAAQVKTEKDAVDYRKNLLGLLQDIPQGQTVKFPDGTEYTGMGKISDITTFQSTDDSGFVRMYTFNKSTNQLTQQDVGRVGKSKSTTDKQDSSPRLSAAGKAVDQLIDPATGYVPVNDYVDMYRNYTQQNPGKGDEFLQEFDPVLYTGRSKDKLRLSKAANTSDNGQK